MIKIIAPKRSALGTVSSRSLASDDCHIRCLEFAVLEKKIESGEPEGDGTNGSDNVGLPARAIRITDPRPIDDLNEVAGFPNPCLVNLWSLGIFQHASWQEPSQPETKVFHEVLRNAFDAFACLDESRILDFSLSEHS